MSIESCDDALKPPDLDISGAALQALNRGQFWFPGLAKKLARHEWTLLEHELGLTPASYGIDRLRSSDSMACRNELVTAQRPAAPDCAPYGSILVEHPIASADDYSALGLLFYDADALSPPLVERKLSKALACLETFPEIASSVWSLVRTIHVLRVGDPAYDVSHSDPDVPFSIFVSLPPGDSDPDCFRLTEAILHEAMHLQLTLLECHVPIISESNAESYSPWKRSNRPVQGVMHGIYVFGVIDVLLEALEHSFDAPTTSYIRNRRTQIAKEVTEVHSEGVRAGLSETGVMLLEAISARFRIGSGP